MQANGDSGVQLTPGQARFAREHDARIGLSVLEEPGDVYLYRDEEWATYRWRVDVHGAAVEVTTLRRPASAL
jgi:hypothetical protein